MRCQDRHLFRGPWISSLLVLALVLGLIAARPVFQVSGDRELKEIDLRHSDRLDRSSVIALPAH